MLCKHSVFQVTESEYVFQLERLFQREEGDACFDLCVCVDFLDNEARHI